MAVIDGGFCLGARVIYVQSIQICRLPDQWLLSIHLLGAACAQQKIGGFLRV